MTKTKEIIVPAYSSLSLDEQINGFLNSHPQIIVDDIKYAISGSDAEHLVHSALIIYDEKTIQNTFDTEKNELNDLDNLNDHEVQSSALDDDLSLNDDLSLDDEDDNLSVDNNSVDDDLSLDNLDDEHTSNLSKPNLDNSTVNLHDNLSIRSVPHEPAKNWGKEQKTKESSKDNLLNLGDYKPDPNSPISPAEFKKEARIDNTLNKLISDKHTTDIAERSVDQRIIDALQDILMNDGKEAIQHEYEFTDKDLDELDNAEDVPIDSDDSNTSSDSSISPDSDKD